MSCAPDVSYFNYQTNRASCTEQNEPLRYFVTFVVGAGTFAAHLRHPPTPVMFLGHTLSLSRCRLLSVNQFFVQCSETTVTSRVRPACGDLLPIQLSHSGWEKHRGPPQSP